jgi:hypothetical protein
MLIARRGGTPTSAGLAREEFLAVCLTGWLALTVAFNSSIVRELTASGPSPEERLRLIGERVGLPAHGRSHSYFILAPLLSALLIEIERGDYLVMANIRTLFAPGANPVRDDIASIVFHWSLITGRDMKAARATVSPGTPVATQQSVAGSSSMLVTAGSTGGNGKVPAGSA